MFHTGNFITCLKLAHVLSESHAALNSSGVVEKPLSRVIVSGIGDAPSPTPATPLSSDDDLRRDRSVECGIQVDCRSKGRLRSHIITQSVVHTAVLKSASILPPGRDTARNIRITASQSLDRPRNSPKNTFGVVITGEGRVEDQANQLVRTPTGVLVQGTLKFYTRR